MSCVLSVSDTRRRPISPKRLGLSIAFMLVVQGPLKHHFTFRTKPRRLIHA